jgi:prolyl 4-hydroxylase
MSSESSSVPIILQHQVLEIPGFPHGSKFAYLLHDVFTADECGALIKRSEEAGYIPAKDGDQSGRSNYRCMMNDQNTADELFRRIRAWLPLTWEYDDPYAEDEKRKIVTDTLASVNPMMRYQRYDPGQEFSKHVDGAYERPDGSQRTHITVQLYLNSDFEGGTTTFFDPLHYKEFCAPCLDVVPKTGCVLLFEHELLHSGAALIRGRKYSMHTDVLYNVCE